MWGLAARRTNRKRWDGACAIPDDSFQIVNQAEQRRLEIDSGGKTDFFIHFAKAADKLSEVFEAQSRFPFDARLDNVANHVFFQYRCVIAGAITAIPDTDFDLEDQSSQ